MKMVTYFNKKDLVSFGNYLLSDERKKRISEVNQRSVTDADLSNWQFGRTKRAWDSITEDDVPEEKKEALRLLKPTLDKFINEVEDSIG